MKPEFKNPQDAFALAIADGVLSIDSSSKLYAGNYMYMGIVDGKDQFKNIETREYLHD
jgi:hypothetical protein